MAQEKLEMTREELIGELVSVDMDFILDTYFGGGDYLHQILEDGFKGYSNMTDEELVAEIKRQDWLEEVVVIKEVQI